MASNDTMSIVESRRNNHINKILNVIRFNNNVSRNDIKKITGYSMTTILNIVEQLLSEGLLYEESAEEGRIGRKPTWLRLNPDGGYFIGIEFNSRKMHCTVLNFMGETVFRTSDDMSLTTDSRSIIDMIIRHIEAAESSLAEAKKKILGVGLGVPGYVDSVKGIAKSYRYFKDWKNIPLVKLVHEKVGYPVYLENNVNVMAFAYKWLFSNGTCDDFIFLSVRTGARMIPVIENRIVRSKNGHAGEIGHIRVGTGHRICTCGKFGCLNTEISDFAVADKIREGIKIGRFERIRQMVSGKTENISVDEFVQAVEEKDPDSLELLDNITDYLSTALAFTVTVLAPKKIILFGGLSKIGSPFFDRLTRKTKEAVVPEYADSFRIEASHGGDDLGAIGASALVMQKQFSFVEYPN